MKPEDVVRYGKAQWAPEGREHLRAEIDALPIRVEGMRVLDLAAGPGAFSAGLLDAGAASVVWHDKDPAFLAMAKERLLGRPVEFELRDMLDLPYPDASFDLVVIRDALHWARDEGALLAALSRLAVPGGWAVVSNHNWRRVTETVRPRWKVAPHLATPFIGLLLRRKPLPTLWVFESLTRRRLERAGLHIVDWTRPRRRDFVTVCRRPLDTTTSF